MFKKSLIAVLFSFIMAMVLGTSVFAADNGEVVKVDAATEMTPEIASVIKDIEKANAKIYAEIAKTQEKTNMMYSKYLEQVKKTDNEKQKVILWEKYDMKVNETISKLDLKTQSITNKEVEKASEAGVKVEVKWILVKFADREALIDPLVAIGW
ncbi:hypothetical protein [Planococcus beijingensis]|uniref:hypothetical protein n=1 Tax=Planococcus beijingensis TaxID=2782551 RepID=UPI00193B257D|nr:hypothetical protein [Planococcus beijingensis]